MIKLKLHKVDDERKIYLDDLYRAMDEAGLSKRRLCKRMGWSRGRLRRYERQEFFVLHVSETQRLLEVLKALSC